MAEQSVAEKYETLVTKHQCAEQESPERLAHCKKFYEKDQFCREHIQENLGKLNIPEGDPSRLAIAVTHEMTLAACQNWEAQTWASKNPGKY